MSATSNPTSSFDHSYELPLRRNLLLLLDLLGLLRFIAGVLLDRLGVAPSQGELRLPLSGQPWGGGEHANDDATLERFLEARSWETGARSLTAPRYRQRRVARPPAEEKLAAEEGDAEGAAAVCAICLAGLESGDFQVIAELCSCSHEFHVACIDAWVGSGDDAATCPLCRAPMLPTAPWDDDGQSLPRARPGD